MHSIAYYCLLCIVLSITVYYIGWALTFENLYHSIVYYCLLCIVLSITVYYVGWALTFENLYHRIGLALTFKNLYHRLGTDFWIFVPGGVQRPPAPVAYWRVGPHPGNLNTNSPWIEYLRLLLLMCSHCGVRVGPHPGNLNTNSPCELS